MHLTLQHHTFHYVVTGDRTRPALLLLHGFLGSHQDFMPILPSLREHFYCIVPDLPGHGKTQTVPGCYTFAATAQSLLALLEHLGFFQTHLLGYSMGGRLALYLTCCFPERFIRVVLESASPGLKTIKERKERVEKDEAIAQKLAATSLSTFLTQWYNNPLFVSLHSYPNAYAAMLRHRHNNNAEELVAALRGLSTGRQPSLWKELSSIGTPTLLLVGSLDPKFIELNQDMLTHCSIRTTSQITLQIVKHCGHNIHLEAPNLYSKKVISFLAN